VMDTPLELVGRARRLGQVAGGAGGAADLVQQRGNVAELAQICQAWGAAIATLHTTSTHHSSAPLATRPWVTNPRRLMVSMSGAVPLAGYAAVLQAYESSRDLRAAVQEVDERWTEHHWIHGNLTATNVQVELCPALRVSFLDLEDAGLGDPAWDLATAVDIITWVSPSWRVMPHPLVDYLLLGYRRAGGPGRLYPAIQAVRAMATAVWVASAAHASTGQEPAEAELATWLDRAQTHAARVGRLMTVA
jgi:aminoglycoside phosphotransferase (APT) family kinase protein